MKRLTSSSSSPSSSAALLSLSIVMDVPDMEVGGGHVKVVTVVVMQRCWYPFVVIIMSKDLQVGMLL